MNDKTLKVATEEARRFLRTAKALEDRMKEDKYVAKGCASKEGGAVRRASMDLTRALAQLRKH